MTAKNVSWPDSEDTLPVVHHTTVTQYINPLSAHEFMQNAYVWFVDSMIRHDTVVSGYGKRVNT